MARYARISTVTCAGGGRKATVEETIWAHDFAYFIASANPRDGSRIVDPLGRLLVTLAPHQPGLRRDPP